MPQAAHPFNMLIRRGIDDRAMYRHALAQVREPGLRDLLSENAHTLDLLIDDLQKYVRAQGKTAAIHGTLFGRVRVAFANASMTRVDQARRDTAWVRCLARCECALLDRFEQQARRHTDSDMACVLHRQLHRLHRIHLDMHCLAGTTHSG